MSTDADITAVLDVARRLRDAAAPNGLFDRAWAYDPQQREQVIAAAVELAADRRFTDDGLARALLLELRELDSAVEAHESELAAARVQDIAGAAVRAVELQQLQEQPPAAVALLREVLPAGRVAEICDLLAISASTWRRWQRQPPRRLPPRTVTVARCAYWLRSSMTDAGVLHWFDHERWQLRERTPRQLLDADPEGQATSLFLVELARGSRAQIAA